MSAALKILGGCTLLLLLLGVLASPVHAHEVFYLHTDALGTVVAETDASGTVVQRSEYEPYGKVLNRPVQNGPGYTGHVEDAATGLTYMQQRYYDPGIGRFLSVDPVTANGNTAGNFNRYWYANNNPYKFTDPDGRFAFLIPVAIIAYRAYSAYDTVTSTVDNASIIANPNAATGDKMLAGAEIAGGAVGGKLGRQLAGRAARLAGEAGDSVKKATDRRVTLRKGTRAQIEANQPRRTNGEMVDPNTGQALKPGEIDVGHKHGQEWNTRKAEHDAAGSSRSEVIEAENNPSLYQLEDRSSNRSRKFEKR